MAGSWFFDGTDDYVWAADSTSIRSPTSAITLAAWIRPGSTQESFCGVVQKCFTTADPWLSYMLQQDGATVRSYHFGISPGVAGQGRFSGGSTALTVNQWYFLAGTWTLNAEARLRIWDASGSLIHNATGGVAMTSNIGYNADQLRTGQSESTNNFGGHMACAGCHNAELTSTQLGTWRTTGGPPVTCSAFFVPLDSSTVTDTAQGNTAGYTEFAAASADGSRSVTVSINAQHTLTTGSPAVFEALRRAEVKAVCAALAD